jgi:hypothetical protein
MNHANKPAFEVLSEEHSRYEARLVEMRRQQDEDEMRECTFQPQINAKSSRSNGTAKATLEGTANGGPGGEAGGDNAASMVAVPPGPPPRSVRGGGSAGARAAAPGSPRAVPLNGFI